MTHDHPERPGNGAAELELPDGSHMQFDINIVHTPVELVPAEHTRPDHGEDPWAPVGLDETAEDEQALVARLVSEGDDLRAELGLPDFGQARVSITGDAGPVEESGGIDAPDTAENTKPAGRPAHWPAPPGPGQTRPGGSTRPGAGRKKKRHPVQTYAPSSSSLPLGSLFTVGGACTVAGSLTTAGDMPPQSVVALIIGIGMVICGLGMDLARHLPGHIRTALHMHIGIERPNGREEEKK
ncbi:hypothetical protein [Streptomyces xantholiticus]|uniref:Uncharacterized protein n=1 Tax=Streptomyces xantholiticus TaxID=68285 RepID=A0ABV1UN51_9ACTN